MPLALVLVNLLISLPDFGSILYARLIQRLGFWAVPFPVPIPVDAPKEERDAIHGLRREDTEPEKRLIRIGGIMTLLFCVMHTEHPQPLPEMFRLGRFWTYIARLLSSKELCASNVSLEILRGKHLWDMASSEPKLTPNTAALAVSGDKALRVWGKQWVKVLNVIENRTEETSSSIIGENGVAGTARRVRIKTEIRKMMM
jgi:nucleoporin GLE1